MSNGIAELQRRIAATTDQAQLRTLYVQLFAAYSQALRETR